MSLSAGNVQLQNLTPLIDGEPASCGAPRVAFMDGVWRVQWPLAGGPGKSVILTVAGGEEPGALRLDLCLEALAPDVPIDALGIRFGKVAGAVRYLRNGYTSWDGSCFEELGRPRGAREEAPVLTGHAVTALVAREGGVAVLGFLRHDRYQSRLRFVAGVDSLSMDVETIVDRADHGGHVGIEPLILLAGSELEETLRQWAGRVARASPSQPRVDRRRIIGWCSWYNLYASIGEQALLDHLGAAVRFRAQYRAPLEFFQVDDGFVPEMGDWLDVKPQFPRGMAALLADIRAAGFVPGLWIAPFMVGNRSRLYAEHPDWVVTDRQTGRPIMPMKFYGEFRWHKRSEEYYVLDITHPDAEAWIRGVFRVWAREWGCGYFKTDFMHFGSDYGPDRAQWHVQGLSRVQVWMRMARLIREEIGDAVWLGCGGPIWAPTGLLDAVRIGRDVGVRWSGQQSAESLLRDQAARNFANGILWQADPDCILLRGRFHQLTDTEVRSLALFAGLSGGVLMTSDHFDEIPPERRALFAELAAEQSVSPCDFPELSQGGSVLIQRKRCTDGAVLISVFNTGEHPAERLVPWSLAECGSDPQVSTLHGERAFTRTGDGIRVVVGEHDSCLLAFSPSRA